MIMPLVNFGCSKLWARVYFSGASKMSFITFNLRSYSIDVTVLRLGWMWIKRSVNVNFDYTKQIWVMLNTIFLPGPTY